MMRIEGKIETRQEAQQETSASGELKFLGKAETGQHEKLTPLVWVGKVWEFGQYVKRVFNGGMLPENSFAAALKHVCPLYEKDGKQMDPHSVQVSLAQYEQNLKTRTSNRH